MPYDMALATLLDSMMFEKTIKAVATIIGDMNKGVGGISLPPPDPINQQRVSRRRARTPRQPVE